jgi:hypothetical protein
VLGLVSHDAHSVESNDAPSPADCGVCVLTWCHETTFRFVGLPLCLVHQAQCECTVLGLVSHCAHSVESNDASSPADCGV